MMFFRLCLIVICVCAVAGCTRYNNAQEFHEAADIDKHTGANPGTTQERPLGPIFGEGYVTK